MPNDWPKLIIRVKFSSTKMYDLHPNYPTEIISQLESKYTRKINIETVEV